jgi:hypothetical protein
MANGFAIRCPHCQKWSYWEDHPNKKTVDETDFKHILEGLKEKMLRQNHGEFVHEKLLRCQSSRVFCPASFEAIICRADDLFTYSNQIESWSFKRHFRLYKYDNTIQPTSMKERWDNDKEGRYCGILFNSLPIQRPRYIELESLMDRELVSRLIAGMCVEIDSPLTFFALNVFQLNSKNDELSHYWMPIEGYSQQEKMVPPRFNSFCGLTRNITMNKLIKEFDNNYSIDKCPHLKNDRCANRMEKAACKRVPKDYNHCPVFMEWRKQKCPCYNSDVTLIRNIEEKWRQGTISNEEDLYRCHAGFGEVAFPIELHGHLIGVAMIGQIFFHSEEIKHASEFISSKRVVDVPKLKWDTLEGEEETLENARYILIGDELKQQRSGESKFLLNREQLQAKKDRLLPNLDRFHESAESHYRDFRGKLESAFRAELLGFIENHKKDTQFFNNHIPYILQRMQEFWAFKGTYLLRYSFGDKRIYKIVWSVNGNVQAYGIDGEYFANFSIESQDMHPCPYLHRRGAEPTYSSRLNGFIPLFEQIIDSTNLNVSKGDCEFIVLVPSHSEIYVFVFAVRDPKMVSSLLSNRSSSISELCQDAIFETCSEIIDKFHSVTVFFDRHLKPFIETVEISTQSMQNEITTLFILLEEHKREAQKIRGLPKTFLQDINDIDKAANVIRSELEKQSEVLQKQFQH